jgi:hypothetical protein
LGLGHTALTDCVFPQSQTVDGIQFQDRAVVLAPRASCFWTAGATLTIAGVFTPPMDGDRTEALIARNHALLRRAAAARTYKLLICDEVGEAVLAAYTARLRARDLLRRRLLNGHACPIPLPCRR